MADPQMAAKAIGHQHKKRLPGWKSGVLMTNRKLSICFHTATEEADRTTVLAPGRTESTLQKKSGSVQNVQNTAGLIIYSIT